jgi:hypothetical protein
MDRNIYIRIICKKFKGIQMITVTRFLIKLELKDISPYISINDALCDNSGYFGITPDTLEGYFEQHVGRVYYVPSKIDKLKKIYLSDFLDPTSKIYSRKFISINHVNNGIEKIKKIISDSSVSNYPDEIITNYTYVLSAEPINVEISEPVNSTYKINNCSLSFNNNVCKENDKYKWLKFIRCTSKWPRSCFGCGLVLKDIAYVFIPNHGSLCYFCFNEVTENTKTKMNSLITSELKDTYRTLLVTHKLLK